MAKYNIHFKKEHVKTHGKGKAKEVLKDHGAKVTHEFKHLIPHVFIIETDDMELIKKLEQHPNIELVSEEKGHGKGGYTFSQGTYDNSWRTNAILPMKEAWEAGFRGQGVKVAILDSGIDTGHPEFNTNGVSCVVAQACFTGESGYVGTLSHGTHCAGLAGARGSRWAEGLGMYGIAPECQLINARVLNNNDYCAWAWVTSGLDWAVGQGAHIISISLQGFGSYSSGLVEAINEAASMGIHVVICAGNYGTSDPAQDNVCFPGNVESAITVANIQYDLTRYPNSSTGPAVDIAAMGTYAYSTVIGGSYTLMTGTSMATPQIAGLLAVIKSVFPLSTPAERVNILLNHIKAGTTGKENEFGAGAATFPLDLNPNWNETDRVTVNTNAFVYQTGNTIQLTGQLIKKHYCQKKVRAKIKTSETTTVFEQEVWTDFQGNYSLNITAQNAWAGSCRIEAEEV